MYTCNIRDIKKVDEMAEHVKVRNERLARRDQMLQ